MTPLRPILRSLLSSTVVGGLVVLPFVLLAAGLRSAPADDAAGTKPPAPAAPAPVAHGWLAWRGPDQNGASTETGLPDECTLAGPNLRWSYELAGRGAPVLANGKLYVLGYRGDGPDLQELLVCLDAKTGKLLWEHGSSDFLSDTVYNRYAIGAPTVDAETANVYYLTAPGLFHCRTADGKLLWRHSLMEEFGRITFPNGRIGSPVVDGDLVMVHAVTSNWGKEGPARDRLYAFEKRTGELVWSTTPGTAPLDNSFATPVVGWWRGRRVLYVGTGCGHMAAIDARTGVPLWRFPFTKGGVNASALLYKDDTLIAIHGKENVDTSESGRMAAIRIPAEVKKTTPDEPMVLDRSSELWRNSLSSFSSSPVLVGDRVYVTVETGSLLCVDAGSGRTLWEHKLGPEQIHASPLAADGKLYVPINEGTFFVLRPGEKGTEVLSTERLPGNCLGSPTVWNGRIYVHTTEKLFCFGLPGDRPEPAAAGPVSPAAAAAAPGPLAFLLPVPADLVLKPGEKAALRLLGVDANGARVPLPAGAVPQWRKFVPATAKVRSEMNAEFDAEGRLSAAPDARLSAGSWEATIGEVKGTMRGRVLPRPPFREEFESYPLAVKHEQETGVMFAYPPLPWIGARFKWEIRERDGSRVLAKTLDNDLFQRSFTFLGPSDLSNYTVEADVMSDGTRRTMSVVGVINQRYVVALIGNAQELEVNSNYDRLKVAVPFAWKASAWYRLKARVDVAADGSGVVRGKAWPRGEPEPAAWTLEVPHKRAHASGSPGLFGFSPQNRVRVYVDNVSVTANE
ncbi:MAG: PQQ-binding-like beta-propeller repeat protein [Planctomycetes bacterium]|nr:PQQ-binding-like beta-propeller repeat protein [Planctomycetota bacterium]